MIDRVERAKGNWLALAQFTFRVDRRPGGLRHALRAAPAISFGQWSCRIEGRTDGEPDSPAAVPEHIVRQVVPYHVGLRAPRRVRREDDIAGATETVKSRSSRIFFAGQRELHCHHCDKRIARMRSGHFAYRATASHTSLAERRKRSGHKVSGEERGRRAAGSPSPAG